MFITPDQMKKGYPSSAMRFMNGFNNCLSDETDSYGIKKLDEKAIMAYNCDKYPNASEEIKEMYEENVKSIHDYLDKGGTL